MASFTQLTLFSFVFIGVFALIFGLMPTQFLTFSGAYDPDYQTDKVAAQFFSAANITAYSQTNTTTVNYPGSVQIDVGLADGHYMELWWGLVVGFKEFQVRHVWPGPFGLWTDYENLAIIEPWRSDLLYPDIPFMLHKVDLETFWENEAENASYCEWERNGYKAQTFIYPYNDTWTIGESWDNNQLNVTMGFDLDLNATSINAFNLITSIMFFSAPNLGLTGIGNTILNAFVAIPLWIMIAIIFLKLIQSIVPFIRGIEE